MHRHRQTQTHACAYFLEPNSPTRPGLTYLEYLPIYLSIGLHSMLREHEGDEGKTLWLLSQAVNGVVEF